MLPSLIKDIAKLNENKFQKSYLELKELVDQESYEGQKDKFNELEYSSQVLGLIDKQNSSRSKIDKIKEDIEMRFKSHLSVCLKFVQ